jgi:hypothetical protein
MSIPFYVAPEQLVRDKAEFDGATHLRARERVRRHLHARGQRRLSPDEVARYLFRRVVSWGRSSNVFLENGARLYLDVGSHPEYATPECDSPYEVVVHDKAGERILEELVARPSSACARRASPATSTCSRTTPTRPATPTAATRTTSPAAGRVPAATPRCSSRSW